MTTKTDKLIQSISLMRMTVLLLTATGILSLAMASVIHRGQVPAVPFEAVKEQLLWLLAASLAGVASASIDYRFWKRAASWLGGITALLLVLVLFGRPVDGSCRWLSLGPIGFEPAELAKLTIAVCLAAWAAARKCDTQTINKGLLYPMLGVALTFGLIITEPNYGTGLLIMLAGLIIMAAAGANKRILALTAIGVALACAAHTWLDPIARCRLSAWYNPAGSPDNAYQLTTSLQAFQRGGYFGDSIIALISESPALPEASTSFILATVGEYLGLSGVAAVIILFLLLCITSIRIISYAPDTFGRLLGIGIIALIGAQALLNITYVIGISPIRGLTLPFMSYGGSALLITFIEIGILESIGQRALLVLSNTTSKTA